MDYLTRHQRKCRQQKKLTCKGILRQVFIRVYRPEMHSVMLVLSTQLCELLPLYLTFSLVELSPPFSVWRCILYIRIQCERGGGYGVLGLRQINTCLKDSLQMIFYDAILHCLLWSPICLRFQIWSKDLLRGAASLPYYFFYLHLFSMNFKCVIHKILLKSL
jgi:hypothetical protein